ncbi:MAG TPA: ABC transporter substrate-binding protein [Clostridiales bacterium]|jgi:NitT/TauT family transport system substrate-binding protein|nr:ABC transporter substrate-binding protein [Clostridiales bacterium]
MKKIILALMCLLLIFTMLAGCENNEEKLREFTLNEVTRSVFYTPLYVAASKGFFEENGLKIEIVTGGGSDKSMTALLAGDAEIALMGPETGVYVINEGKEDHPVIIGQLTKRDGSFLISRVDEKDTFTWESLEGKTIIGGRRGGMPFMTLEYILKKHGLTPGVDVTVLDNIQFNLIAGAFEGGTGDYVPLFEPTASMLVKEGKGYIVSQIGLESGEIPYTTFMVTQKMIKDDPQFIEAFLRSIYAAQKWVVTATDNEIATAVQPFFPDTSIEILEAVAKSYREADCWMQNPIMTEDSFNRLLDVIETAGELKSRVDFTDLVDNSFAQKIVGE